MSDFRNQIAELNKCNANGYTKAEREQAEHRYNIFLQACTESDYEKYCDLSDKINNLESKEYRKLYNIIAKYGLTLKDDAILY